MKTFRFSLVALAATALFTACSDEAVVEQQQQPTIGGEQAIAFRLQGGIPETRATATTDLNVDAFVVYGVDDQAVANIFDGMTIARQVGGNFDYNPKKYYSNGAASAHFVAYSPVSANILSSTVASPLVTASFEYEVKAPDATGITAQEDFLIADTSFTTITSTVNLNFRHALSRIFVKAVNDLSEDVVITGLELKNLKSKGTVTTPLPLTWAADASSIRNYSYLLAPTGVAVKAGTGTGSPNNPVLVTSMEQGMMVLPQPTVNGGTDDYTAGDFALEVTYDVANLTGEKAYVYLSPGYAFVAGNQYAITIEFDGTDLIEIDFTIEVTEFTPIVNIP